MVGCGSAAWGGVGVGSDGVVCVGDVVLAGTEASFLIDKVYVFGTHVIVISATHLIR